MGYFIYLLSIVVYKTSNNIIQNDSLNMHTSLFSLMSTHAFVLFISKWLSTAIQTFLPNTNPFFYCELLFAGDDAEKSSEYSLKTK